jgi:predicted phosphodiesterase
MRFLIIGDIHGNFESFFLNYRQLKDRNVFFDIILQVGDFGMWDNTLQFYKQQMNTYYKNDIEEEIIFVRGNHEEYTRYNTDFFNKYPIGFEKYFKNNIPFHLDGKVIKRNDIFIAGLGGADSTDKNWRIESQNNPHMKEQGIKLWWEEEIVNKDYVQYLKNYINENNINLDIMISHDYPYGADIFKNYISDRRGNQLLNIFYYNVNPCKVWFFGHHHRWLIGKDVRSNTQFVGLPESHMGYVIYDTDKKEIEFHNSYITYNGFDLFNVIKI